MLLLEQREIIYNAKHQEMPKQQININMNTDKYKYQHQQMRSVNFLNSRSYKEIPLLCSKISGVVAYGCPGPLWNSAV